MLLVEGLIDVHHLRAKELRNIAAVGGARVNAELIPHIDRLGIDTIVLALDNDTAGREGTSRAIENASRAVLAALQELAFPVRDRLLRHLRPTSSLSDAHLTRDD